MEKIVKKVMIPKLIEVQSEDFKEVVTYKTIDGQEFPSFDGAQKHEDRIIYDSVQYVETNLDDIGYYWYKAKTQEELDACTRHITNRAHAHGVRYIKVGEWFNILWNDDGEDCTLITLTEFKKNVDELYKFLESDE